MTPEGTGQHDDTAVPLMQAPEPAAVTAAVEQALRDQYGTMTLPPSIVSQAARAALGWIEAHLDGADPRIDQIHPRTEMEAAYLLTTITHHFPTLRADVLAGAGIVEMRNQSYVQALGLLMDLDRCPHGRHSSDSCLMCPGGRSSGNPHLPPGLLIGRDYSGRALVVPEADRLADPEAWRMPHEAQS